MMGIRSKISLYRKINWYKTVYFNFKKFPIHIAKKLPVVFYGKVKLGDISGCILINAPISMGMIKFGKQFEKFSISKGIAELHVRGNIIFKGYCAFGKDFRISIAKGAVLEIGNCSGMGSDCRLICEDMIVFGENVRISYETQVMDSNFHNVINTLTGTRYPMLKPIRIGNNVFIGNRSSILSGTTIPDFCIVASNSLCSKDYSNLGSNILIGGLPSKLITTNISRDWQGEDQASLWEDL